jgi:hypothetical protein
MVFNFVSNNNLALYKTNAIPVLQSQKLLTFDGLFYYTNNTVNKTSKHVIA